MTTQTVGTSRVTVNRVPTNETELANADVFSTEKVVKTTVDVIATILTNPETVQTVTSVVMDDGVATIIANRITTDKRVETTSFRAGQKIGNTDIGDVSSRHKPVAVNLVGVNDAAKTKTIVFAEKVQEIVSATEVTTERKITVVNEQETITD